jgi:ribosomal protein L3
VGDAVDVTGTSKGKGWAGTIKRHNFHRGRKTHGGRSYRRPGSIGSMYPQRIFPGKKMAGHMGAEQVTTKRLQVALVDTDLNVIGVTGAVPGPRKGIVVLKEANKMAVLTYTKAGAKATTPAKLDKKVFGVDVKSHDLLKASLLGLPSQWPREFCCY